ncbi:hypothetical protein V8F20_008607 [Naviculisporaceae sp. PSN 640]
MSNDIALSLITTRASTSTVTTTKKETDKEKGSTPSRIPKSPSSTNLPGATEGESSSPSPSFANFFSSLLSLKSFLTLPSPAALPVGTLRKMPAFLMIATVALLFTSSGGGNFIPVVNAGTVPGSNPISTVSAHTTSTGMSAPIYNHGHFHHLHSQDDSDSESNSRPHSIVPRAEAGLAISPLHPGPIPWNTRCTHPSEEGIWNCMTTTWQRCVRGRWSVIMRSEKSGAHEPDTSICIPDGITKEVLFIDLAEAALMAAAAGAGAVEGQHEGVTGSAGTAGAGAVERGGVSESESGTGAGTEAKLGSVHGGGRYWSAAEGVMLKGDRGSTRDRMVFVLGVAGVVGLVLGMPPV